MIINHGTLLETYAYDDTTGQLLRHTDVYGIVKEYEYHAATHDLIGEQEGNGAPGQPGVVASVYDYAGCAQAQRGVPCRIERGGSAAENIEVNEDDQLTQYTKGGFAEEYALDLNGNFAGARHTVQDSQVYRESRNIDQRGFSRTNITRDLETGTGVSSPQRVNVPDQLGRLSQTTLGAETRVFTYDHQSRPRGVTVGDYEKSFEYDLNGNLRFTRERSQVVEERRYDGLDRLARIIVPNIGARVFTYDNNDRIDAVRVEDTSGNEVSSYRVTQRDEVGRARAWTQDGAAYSMNYVGLSSVLTGPLGTVRQTTTWDTSGRVTNVSVPGVTSIARTYDGDGRLDTETSQEGPQSARNFSARYEYNTRGELTAIRDRAVGGDLQATIDRRLDGAVSAVHTYPGNGPNNTTTLLNSIAGEPLGRIKASGTQVRTALDEQRRPATIGPNGVSAGARRVYTYNSSMQMTSFQEQDGTGRWTFDSFDAQNRPQQITTPVGTIGLIYDVAGRLRDRTSNRTQPATAQYSDHDTFTYDPLNRLLTAANGDASVTLTHYTAQTPYENTELTVGGVSWEWRTGIREDGAPLSLTYPSGQEVTYGRDTNGLLQGINIVGDGAVTVPNVTYEIAGVPQSMRIGPMVRRDTYDDRHRLTSRSYTNVQGGANETLLDLRYGYDGADREIARQSAGRTDFFAYDADDRLIGSELGARPSLNDTGAAPWTVSVPSRITGSWRAGDYGRQISYNAAGSHADLVQATSTDRRSGEDVPFIASAINEADALGYPTIVDNALVPRTRDGLGNAETLELDDGWATVQHDGLSRLRQITTARGVTVRYGYRADGVRVTRQIICPQVVTGFVCENRQEVLFYDGLRLLEVFRINTAPNAPSGSGTLAERYYYADEGEVPFAADLIDPNTDTLERYYFMTDRQGSVLGLVDEAGTVVERVTYDPWGRPSVGTQDALPPVIASIEVESSGQLAIHFSENVLTPSNEVSSGNPEVITSLHPLESAISLVAPGSNNEVVDGSWHYSEEVSSTTHRRFTILRFEPSDSPTSGTTYAVHLEANALLDRWSNAVGAVTQQFTWGANTRYTGPTGGTDFAPIRESAFGNEVLFQSHSFEGATGLYHMRGRVFDPRTGLFLEIDPYGFEDSANMYAGFANDPINHRDPTGTRIRLAQVREDSDRIRLLVELGVITGLDVDVCSINEAYKFGCVPGDLMLRGPESDKTTERFSPLARNILLDAIEDPDAIDVVPTNGTSVRFGNHPHSIEAEGERAEHRHSQYNFAFGTAEIDFLDFAQQRGSEDILRSDNVGFTFLHELLHHAVVKTSKDSTSISGLQGEVLGDESDPDVVRPGPVEDVLNVARDQLHLPRRLDYFVRPSEEEGQKGVYCLQFATGKMCFDKAKVSNEADTARKK